MPSLGAFDIKINLVHFVQRSNLVYSGCGANWDGIGIRLRPVRVGNWFCVCEVITINCVTRVWYCWF